MRSYGRNLMGTVTAGGSVSSAFEIDGYDSVAILTPGTIAGSTLQFRSGIATNNGTLLNPLTVVDSGGNTLSVAAAASQIITDVPELRPLRYVALVMGGGTQATDAIFQMLVK